VAVGTATFHDPSACQRIVRELEDELSRRGVARLSELVGLAHERNAPARLGLTGGVW
jgi:dihydroorotate dehydrogenase (NAD+) catalytic subunit